MFHQLGQMYRLAQYLEPLGFAD